MAKGTSKKVNLQKRVAYTSEAIEVLTGLEPVKRRPGMYTDTTRPNHLAHEAIDNSVDEAIAGFAHVIEVRLFKDGSLCVMDDGRGMPVDVHPQHKLTGVELILTRLHAGAKFSNKTYEYSGGLHGVGISVVNALSTKLIVQVKKKGVVYQMEFENGAKVKNLSAHGKCLPEETGTSIHFWPNSRYFDSSKFDVPELKHTLRSKALLCPGLRVRFYQESNDQTTEWHFEEGLTTYLQEMLQAHPHVPDPPWVGHFSNEGGAN